MKPAEIYHCVHRRRDFALWIWTVRGPNTMLATNLSHHRRYLSRVLHEGLPMQS